MEQPPRAKGNPATDYQPYRQPTNQDLPLDRPRYPIDQRQQSNHRADGEADSYDISAKYDGDIALQSALEEHQTKNDTRAQPTDWNAVCECCKPCHRVVMRVLTHSPLYIHDVLDHKTDYKSGGCGYQGTGEAPHDLVT